MINLIEIIKSKRQEFGGKLVLLILCLTGSIIYTNLSIHEYFDRGFSIVFAKNIMWLCASIVALAGVLLRKPLTTSSTSENELNSVSDVNNSKEILKTARNIIFALALSIPVIFTLNIILYNIFLMINENANYSDYSKTIKSIRELLIPILYLILFVDNYFIKAEAKVLKK